MSTPAHYSVSGLVYQHLSLAQPHSIPDSSHPHPSFTPDMSWRQSHHSPSHSQSMSSQMQPLIQHPQDHLTNHLPDYAAQQSFMSRHAPDAYSNHPPSSAGDPGPSSHSISFDSPQIDSSIGPDRGLRTRRVRLPERVQSHGELPDYPAISQSYDHTQNPSSYVPQASRPPTPTPQTIYTLTGDVPDDVSLSNPDPFLEGLAKRRGGENYEWRVYYPPASRSASGSAGSASSNPRSASPALSVASVLTVSSSASVPVPACQEGFPSSTHLLRKEVTKKKRLWNVDRFHICQYAQTHPGTKQEDIAAHFGVERSTVSKILKQKARWLHVSPEEKVLVAKLRPSKFPSLERRLEEWVKLASKAGKTLTDSVLRQKAREFGDEMGYTPEKFKASSGWLENFKHRHGIRRGVWHGNGYEDAKYRACGMDFIPPTDPNARTPSAPYVIRHYSPTPVPMPMEESSHGHGDGHGHGHGDHDIGHKSEEEDGREQDGMSTGASAMHPPPLSLQQAWPQMHEEAPTQGEPSNASEAYYSPEQPQHIEYPPQSQSQHDAEQAELGPPMLEAQPIAIRDEESGEQVYVMPVMPEVMPEQTAPTLAEAEMALDKVILYIEQNGNEAVLDDDDYKFLMGIKYKVFGKMARRTFSGTPHTKA